MQVIFKKKSRAKNLTELKPGEAGVLDKLDLPEDDAQRLMELEVEGLTGAAHDRVGAQDRRSTADDASVLQGERAGRDASPVEGRAPARVGADGAVGADRGAPGRGAPLARRKEDTLI